MTTVKFILINRSFIDKKKNNYNKKNINTTLVEEMEDSWKKIQLFLTVYC